MYHYQLEVLSDFVDLQTVMSKTIMRTRIAKKCSVSLKPRILA